MKTCRLPWVRTKKIYRKKEKNKNPKTTKIKKMNNSTAVPSLFDSRKEDWRIINV